MGGKIRWQQIKNWFDWTPVSVEGPVAEYQDFQDHNNMFLGYKVIVIYKYHGTKVYSFSDDEEKLGVSSKRRALRRASDFCESIRKKIREKTR